MDTIFRLREALVRVLTYSSEDASRGGQELFEELMLQKNRLLNLLDVGQRSPQEQREVESGEYSYGLPQFSHPISLNVQAKSTSTAPRLLSTQISPDK